MCRSSAERLADVLAAIDRTLIYRPRLDDADPAVASMAYDAVLRNLAVIEDIVDRELVALRDAIRSRLLDAE